LIGRVYILTLSFGLFNACLATGQTTENPASSTQPHNTPFDDTREASWGDGFREVEIKTGPGSDIQKAYFLKSKGNTPAPLIVSLHTWSGSYSQKDEIAKLSREKGMNYIHPDFRGPNKTKDACCSELALGDIDAAISWAIDHANVDTSKIYVIGVSGGGYATLSTFMRSKHRIKKFSAWASIADLVAWYDECRIARNKYAEEILQCTASDSTTLNIRAAKDRSPLYWKTPVSKLKESKLFIYAGIHDGIRGSVPITHSIDFYNKVLADGGVSDSSAYVSSSERKMLLLERRPLGKFGTIGDRQVCLMKEYNDLKLVIFEGAHEMLTEFAFDELIK
jgi:dipeptidyl aminopeptidase/acylaminoacyl peptidase